MPLTREWPNVCFVGRALTNRRFGLLRRLARPDAWRSAFAFLLLLTFATATSLAQSHVHFTAVERANLAASLDDGAPVAVAAQKQAPAQLPDRHDTQCPMCQAQIASGAYVATQVFALDIPALAQAPLAAEPDVLAHGTSVAPWRSRAPPTA